MDKKLLWILFVLVHHLAFTQTSVFNKSNRSVNDSVKVPASTLYSNESFLRRLVMGRNYRVEWATPVTMPVFNLKESGLKIESLGGGMQTKSLSLRDKNNREWVLRTVDKDAEGTLPKSMRNTLFEKVVQDMISAGHPYAPLTVGYLAQKSGIIAPRPKLYYVPDDPDLEPYRSVFAHKVCLLELKEPMPDRSETDNTEDMLKKIGEENDHQVRQEVVLRARLLDMLVADWDRHSGQWRWGKKDSGSLTWYYAIPRDRDQAFFMSQGFLSKIAKPFFMPYINGFKKRITGPGLINLNYKSRSFDQTFLNELDGAMWNKIVTDFRDRLSDSVIIAAVKKIPAEIFVMDSSLLVNKLLGRRESLPENAMKYYRFLSVRVQVSGTEEDELFKISGDGKNITVSVFRLKDGKANGTKIYQRTFQPEETRYIYLVGRQGADIFETDESVSSTIKIKIFGGEGIDQYDLNGAVRKIVYDLRSEKNVFKNRERSKIHLR